MPESRPIRRFEPGLKAPRHIRYLTLDREREIEQSVRERTKKASWVLTPKGTEKLRRKARKQPRDDKGHFLPGHA